jgi:ABC-type nickel/cobalt efflux system permease component RcnA
MNREYERNGTASYKSVTLEEKSARERYIRVAAIVIVITAGIWNIWNVLDK